MDSEKLISEAEELPRTVVRRVAKEKLSNDGVQESTLHAIWECPALRQVWDSAFSWVIKDYPSFLSFKDLVELVGQHSQRLDLFATAAWLVWYRRNKLRLKETCLPVEKIYEQASSYLFEFQHRPQSSIGKAWPKAIKCKPPACGDIKSNYDGATFNETGEERIGVVVRLDSSEVLAALSEKIPLLYSIEVLEALAARRAAQFVVELGLQYTVLEGDSELVFKALTTDSSPRSSIGHIIKDTLSIVSSLRTHSFSHTRRQDNSVAYAFSQEN
ncbi:hypothetical protein SO802_019198 [Lithocarpus litseifolius]|uniref:RNase H type-1 domain-containing protein n=1 Tax=Lithocarpus litseifolius TaxID=425828 RepID=A0AAW2CRG4_9ROSI